MQVSELKLSSFDWDDPNYSKLAHSILNLDSYPLKLYFVNRIKRTSDEIAAYFAFAPWHFPALDFGRLAGYSLPLARDVRSRVHKRDLRPHVSSGLAEL